MTEKTPQERLEDIERQRQEVILDIIQSEGDTSAMNCVGEVKASRNGLRKILDSEAKTENKESQKVIENTLTKLEAARRRKQEEEEKIEKYRERLAEHGYDVDGSLEEQKKQYRENGKTAMRNLREMAHELGYDDFNPEKIFPELVKTEDT